MWTRQASAAPVGRNSIGTGPQSAFTKRECIVCVRNVHLCISDLLRSCLYVQISTQARQTGRGRSRSQGLSQSRSQRGAQKRRTAQVLYVQPVGHGHIFRVHHVRAGGLVCNLGSLFWEGGASFVCASFEIDLVVQFQPRPYLILHQF